MKNLDTREQDKQESVDNLIGKVTSNQPAMFRVKTVRKISSLRPKKSMFRVKSVRTRAIAKTTNS